MPEPWTAELEAELPEELQDSDKVEIQPCEPEAAERGHWRCVSAACCEVMILQHSTPESAMS